MMKPCFREKAGFFRCPDREPMNFITSFFSRSYRKLGPTGKVMFWLGVMGVVIPIAFELHSWQQARDLDRYIKTIIDTKSKSQLPELQKLFPGGFEMFAVLRGGSATAGHTIIRGSTSYSIDITWGNATITELTPSSMTLRLQDLKIKRTETTPSGTQSAGTIQINGAAIWRIDRGTKLVYINNAMSFWGYVLGGFVISDTDDVLVVAIGLQKIE